MRHVLFGDGESPHLLKWARGLAAWPEIELWAVSSRGFLPELAALVPAERRLALGTRPRAAGNNVALLLELPRLGRWLRRVQPDWIHAHYLSSHGTLAWLARRGWGLRARLAGSAWGSDILVTPARSLLWRALTRRVLRACTLTTSDSQVMAERMRELGARDVMVFPFGLEALPAEPGEKEPGLVFTNRGLEPIYDPQRVLQVFAAFAAWRPDARLVVANDGSLRPELERLAAGPGLAGRVSFVGRLGAAEQETWYRRAQWYLSLPRSDSVSVSVIEAMAHGCLPVLSDLPANRELVRDGDNGLILADRQRPAAAALEALQGRALAVAGDNRAWVLAQALFPPAVGRFVARLRALSAP